MQARDDARARVEVIRGMCTDEAPYVDIDVALGGLLDLLDATPALGWVRDVRWTHKASDDFPGCTE